MATHASVLVWRIHRQRSLAGCNPQVRKELGTTGAAEHACVCVQARLPPRLSPLVGYHKIRLWTCDAQQALAAHPVHSAVRLLGPESSPSAWVSTPGLFPVSVNLGFSFQLCCVT